ncbi:MAG TPA: DUF6069 family protein [Nocardioidaceae bacterium]|nr:DUF6069 family protein [Nocardioidaceae bacterium]
MDGDQARSPDRTEIDAGKLWAGGVATAIVAALVAIVGLLVARGVLDIAVLVARSEGAWHTASTAPYAAGAVVGALVATALMHVLALTTPRPTLFFGWILFLVGVVVAVWPFTTGAALDEQIATAVLDAIIVVAVWSLVDGTARRTTDVSGR